MHHGGLARSGPQVWGFPSSPKCNCSGVVHPGDRGRVCYLFDFTHRKSKQRERQKDFPKVIQNICSGVQFPKSKFSQRPTLFLDSSYPGTVYRVCSPGETALPQSCLDVHTPSGSPAVFRNDWCVCPFIWRINCSQLVSAFLNCVEAVYQHANEVMKKEATCISCHFPYIMCSLHSFEFFSLFI